MGSQKKNTHTQVEDYSMHDEYARAAIPTGEYSGTDPESLIGKPTPIVSYPLPGANMMKEEIDQRDTNLDPQYIWRGKFKENQTRLEIKAPIIYRQEKIFPRMIIEEMKRHTALRHDAASAQKTLWEGTELDPNAQPGFYDHEEGWKNRMILGDSLQVMASLAENESLRGKVQMIYMDPPYGIKFNSFWQPTTKSTNVSDGKKEDLTREPEMVKAFRDTWHDGIQSYLGYLRDRLMVARDLLSESGSCFVQISMDNIHKVRVLLDEVFGENNCISMISYATTSGNTSATLDRSGDYILWYAKNKSVVKYRELYYRKVFGGPGSSVYTKLKLPNGDNTTIKEWELLNKKEFTYQLNNEGLKAYGIDNLMSQGNASAEQPFTFINKVFKPSKTSHWKANYPDGLNRLAKANRLEISGQSLRYVRFFEDFPVVSYTNNWNDTSIAGFASDKIYVVQTSIKVIQRCLLMATDPGDLVLDPTCGSGTTAYVAEQWGRRWITIDTSRVALALARKRLMTAKFPYYLLADSEAGIEKEMQITKKAIVRPTFNKISQGFVYNRVPHVKLKDIANNTEIDLIWSKYESQSKLLCEKLGVTEEWQISFEPADSWTQEQLDTHKLFLEMRQKRQKEIDDSISRASETEYLFDEPYEDKKKIRVTGPFTIESVAPVRAMIANPDGSVTDPVSKIAKDIDYGGNPDFVSDILACLRRNGVKQARKQDKIDFTSVSAWQGKWIVGEGWSEASENQKTKHYAIAIGPEFGSVTRNDMMNAKKEANECGFDVLLYCAFNFEAYVEEGSSDYFGKMKVLHARMNSDLHMSTDLKDTGSGNPFIIFGEPDITVDHTDADEYIVTLKGVDVFDPKSGDVRSDNADAIDCWMLDSDYNGQAFFARQVFFPGRDGVYNAFKKFLKNDIDEEEWEAVAKTTSQPFARPLSGQIAVKVINHFGDEVMKIFDIK